MTEEPVQLIVKASSCTLGIRFANFRCISQHYIVYRVQFCETPGVVQLFIAGIYVAFWINFF